MVAFEIEASKSVETPKIDTGTLSKCLQVLNSIQAVSPCISSFEQLAKLTSNGDLILRILPDWIGSSKTQADEAPQNDTDDSANIFGYL